MPFLSSNPPFAGTQIGDKTLMANWFGGLTNEAKITAAIVRAVELGAKYVYVPANMLPYDPAKVTFNSSIRMIREGGNPADYDVKAYGAAGDGVTDDRNSIQAAINGAVAAGSGTIKFPHSTGNYLLTSLGGSVSLPIPVAGANFTTVSQAQQYHFYLLNPTGLKFVGEGITIKSSVTNGGVGILFDGAQDVDFRGITLESVASFDGSGNPILAGMNMIGFTSTARDSEQIAFLNVKTVNSYAGFYVFGDAASAFRVRNVTLTNFNVRGGEYGIAIHNNGDNITFNNVRVVGETARAYFAYGVDNHQGQIFASGTSNNLFGQFLIKAYDRDTTNIRLKLRTNNSSNGGVYKLIFQSQHHPATQPTPAVLRNIDIDYSDVGTTGSGINFQYIQDFVVTATVASTIFDNIRIAGHTTGGVDVDSVQTPRGLINIDDLVPTAGSIWQGVYNNKGFYRQLLRTYVPLLQFAGAAVGMIYTTQTGEYYVDGNFVTVFVEILLSAKGASVGAATLTLPAAPAVYANMQPVITGVGYSGMAGLTGPITGTVTANGFANLMQQGAAAVTNLSDANFTNTSRIMVTLRYPI